MSYEESLLYGRHHDLKNAAKKEAVLLRERREQLRKSFGKEDHEIKRIYLRIFDKWKKLSETHAGQMMDDWLFLTTLGIAIALFSFVIDLTINRINAGRLFLLNLLRFSIAAQFFGWVGFFIVFTCFSVGITHIIAPTAIGSGIPEVKTMMRGVVLKEYLTFRTFIAKFVGIITAVGSGLPVGREGPLVHIAGTTAAFIARQLPSFSSGFQNYEKRMADILAPASAVGVSCTFGATIGGLLYSIESTATYYAIRNYWRSFYASAVGTLFYRFINMWINEEATLVVLNKTNLRQEVAYTKYEVIAFSLLGFTSVILSGVLMYSAACGLCAICFIALHKLVVSTIREQRSIKQFLQTNRLVYPAIVAFTVGALQFPPGIGRFYAGELTDSDALTQLFYNETFTDSLPQDIEEQRMVKSWLGPWNNPLLTIGFFTVLRICMCAVSTTCPFPCGVVVPAFAIGAGLGRLTGELVSHVFPDGIDGYAVVPGGYALIGSAAFAGAITQTISPVVIIFELTGQLGHTLPCLVAVMVANVFSRIFSPSLYDVIIELKQLPYLRAKIQSDNEQDSHWKLAEDVMVKELQFLTLKSTYQDASKLLAEHTFKEFPIVNSAEEMMLIGTIRRQDLHEAVHAQFTSEHKMQYFRQKLYAQLQQTESAMVVQPKRIARRRFTITEVAESDLLRNSSTSSFTNSRQIVPSSSKTSFESSYSGQNVAATPVSATGDASEHVEKVHRVRFQVSTSMSPHDPEQESEWEMYELTQTIDFERCRVNFAPFQIVNKMSLYQVHSLFSLLSLHHTLVTNTGQLVGVISLTEVRSAVEGEVKITASSRKHDC